jgi:hypothetical protein
VEVSGGAAKLILLGVLNLIWKSTMFARQMKQTRLWEGETLRAAIPAWEAASIPCSPKRWVAAQIVAA